MGQSDKHWETSLLKKVNKQRIKTKTKRQTKKERNIKQKKICFLNQDNSILCFLWINLPSKLFFKDKIRYLFII